jgi:para-nitrobenzyl esterase
MITSFPAVFEDGAVIPAGGFSTLQAGTYPNKVPVILGSNKEELKLFFFADPSFSGRDDLFQIVTSYGSDLWKAAGVDGVARALRSNADQPDVYAYQFLWGAGGETGESMIPDPWGFLLGSFHSLEIPFFFGNDTVNVLMQLLVFTEGNRPGREALSSAMMAYAARFVATGNPNEAGSGLPEWEPWSNDPDAPKSILFDVDADQALDIQMSEDEFTESGVAERMAAEVPEPLYSEALSYLTGWL